MLAAIATRGAAAARRVRAPLPALLPAAAVHTASPPPPATTGATLAALAASRAAPPATHSRGQLKTLATLRALLRHGAKHVALLPPEGVAVVGDGSAAGLAHWRRAVVALYRAQAGNTNKAAVRGARAAAADVLTTFEAVAAQQGLVRRYAGADPDATHQRRAVARFVGLEIPDTVPVGRTAADFAGKYAAPLANKSVDVSSLTGLDNVKAQLYGVQSVLTSKLSDAGKAADLAAHVHQAPATAAAAPATPASGSSTS